MKTIKCSRRYFQIDLIVLAPLNPTLSVSEMHDALQSTFFDQVEQFRSEMDEQRDGSITIGASKDRFKVKIVNYDDKLEQKILKLLDSIVIATIPLVPGNPNKFKSRWRFTEWK